MYSTTKSTSSWRKSSSVGRMKVYWLLLLLLVLCGCPTTTMAVKSRNAKSWLQHNLVKDNVYVFPMTGIQVHFLKVMDEPEEAAYYNGEGNVQVKYSSKLVDGTIITPETQTTLNSDTMIMGLWVRTLFYGIPTFHFLLVILIIVTTIHTYKTNSNVFFNSLKTT